MNLPSIISLAITALSIMLLASLLHINRIKCLIAAVLGSLLSGFLSSILAGIGLSFGFLGTALTIICITLIAWLFSQHRVRSLIAIVLGVLLGGWINSLIMPLLSQILG
jgi:hypothetical protein